jgi:hypothetical protein
MSSDHFLNSTLMIGIEQEFVFTDKNGQYLDADNFSYAAFSEIVDQFPAHKGDDAYLDCKSLEKYPKRCYVEGFERHDAEGNTVETIPKGLEIRTLPHRSVDALVTEFRNTYIEVMRLARQAGLSPVLTSRHPFKDSLEMDSQIGVSEQRVRTESRLALAKRAMLSHGLHVNLSVSNYSPAKMQSIVEKINYYMPALVPWSYSSPFHKGKAFEGLCARNYFRAGTRNMADLDERHGIQVLEFRAFDACGDKRLLKALMLMYVGFILDETLPGRSATQDSEQLMRSSLTGFANPEFQREGRAILQASKAVLGDAGDSLELLETMLEQNDSWSTRMKSCYAKTGSIIDSISDRYSF